MKTVFLTLLLHMIYFSGCSTRNVYQEQASLEAKQKQRIDNFVQEVVADPPSPDKKHYDYVRHYQSYLYRVHDIFQKNGVEPKFDGYLTALRNTAQILEGTEETLGKQYKLETGKDPDPGSREYQLYRTENMTRLYDRLNEERVTKLRNHLDTATFSQLLENNSRFNNQVRTGRTELVVPL